MARLFFEFVFSGECFVSLLLTVTVWGRRIMEAELRKKAKIRRV